MIYGKWLKISTKCHSLVWQPNYGSNNKSQGDEAKVKVILFAVVSSTIFTIVMTLKTTKLRVWRKWTSQRHASSKPDKRRWSNSQQNKISFFSHKITNRNSEARQNKCIDEMYFHSSICTVSFSSCLSAFGQQTMQKSKKRFWIIYIYIYLQLGHLTK